jgi:hypothetical protein
MSVLPSASTSFHPSLFFFLFSPVTAPSTTTSRRPNSPRRSCLRQRTQHDTRGGAFVATPSPGATLRHGLVGPEGGGRRSVRRGGAREQPLAAVSPSRASPCCSPSLAHGLLAGRRSACQGTEFSPSSPLPRNRTSVAASIRLTLRLTSILPHGI